jgi:hypothetical protein
MRGHTVARELLHNAVCAVTAATPAGVGQARSIVGELG